MKTVSSRNVPCWYQGCALDSQEDRSLELVSHGSVKMRSRKRHSSCIRLDRRYLKPSPILEMSGVTPTWNLSTLYRDLKDVDRSMIILKSFPTEGAREQDVKGAGGGSKKYDASFSCVTTILSMFLAHYYSGLL
jgi:hypothetical protein